MTKYIIKGLHMYHHRYQPPSHLANKNAASFASNNYSINSHPSQSAINNNNSLNNNNSSTYSGIPHHIIEERHDVIFRRVRGILNKITPETFDKLSKELVNVGLDSPRTLRGVIYLLFDKALKDLKYSSLYAKLCQELSEKAPNFEQEPGPNTFCKFLISKCEDEFERRRKATEDFDSKNELTDEEYEQKAIAKQKMLGNIKFICELGKKRLLQEEILHECIRGLLSKKKERPVQDQAQDLECLCQIMRTIGSLLDIQASRNLMNQYFERIDLFSEKLELPSRIRFMLKDVIDLRNNNWRPRPFQREDNIPQTLSKLREEAGYDPSTSSTIDKFGNSRSLIGISDLSKLHGNKLSMLIDDEPSFTTSTDFHWGPAFSPLDQSFDAFSSKTTGIKNNTSSTVTTPSTNSLVSTPVFQKPSQFQHNNPFSPPDNGRFDGKIMLNSTVGQLKSVTEPEGIIKGSAFEKRPFSDNPNSMILRNDRESQVQLRNKLTNIVSPIRIQQREEQAFVSNNTQKFNTDSSRQMQNSRGSNISPPGVRPTIRRNLHEMNQHPAQPMMNQNHRFDSRNLHNEFQENRDRRFQRSDYPNHEYRQPRFSNNVNYRQIRNNDRQPPINREQYYFERSNHKESESNSNWRSGPSSTSVTAPQIKSNSDNTTSFTPRTLVQDRPNDPPIESKLETSKLVRHNDPPRLVAANQFNEMNRKPSETYPDAKIQIDKNGADIRNDRSNFSSAFSRNQPAKVANHSIVQPRIDNSSLLQRKEQTATINTARFSEVRQSQVMRDTNITPARFQPRRPTHEMNQPAPNPANLQNYRFNPNSMNVDSSEKRPDPRKVYSNNSLESEQQQRTKFLDNGPFYQDRNFNRAPINRNQQTFENLQSYEPDRNPSWRKGVTIPPNNTLKEQPSQPATTVLPRPPTKISDTNFSLRPSHLLGRASLLVAAPSSNSIIKPDEASNSKLKDGQELQDLAKLSIKPVTRFVVGGNQAPSESTKVSSDVNLDNGAKVAAPDASLARAAARDLHVGKFITVVDEYLCESSANINRLTTKVKELKIPKIHHQDCLVSILKKSITKSENERDNIGKLFVQLLPSVFEIPSLLNAFKIIFDQMHVLEVETPKVKSLVAEFLSQAIYDGLLALEELGVVLSGGKHHPLFLLFLQKLEKIAGQAWLSEKFIASKINLIDMLPEVDRSKDRLASILRDRCLGFLDPMLTIEPDLWEQMKEKDPSPAAVYRWIKDNVDQTIQSTPTFAHVLISCLMKYIHSVANEKSKTGTSDQGDEVNAIQSNKSSPSSSSLSTSDTEKELLIKYQQVLQAILKDKQMQLATLYALQAFYHGLDFPKGSLLRWFHMLYDTNIVDDDVFFIWKEEINDEFPGKGQALFQVNTWLNWLAEAESEEEEDM